MADGRSKGTWFEEGYGKPKGDAELRVEHISTTYRSLPNDKLNRVLMQLENLVEEGELRPGYKDRARRLKLRVNKRLKAK